MEPKRFLILLTIAHQEIQRRRIRLLTKVLNRRKQMIKHYLVQRKRIQEIFILQSSIPDIFFQINIPRFRSVNKKDRSSHAWNKLLNSDDDNEYFEKFRMKRKTFHMICNKLKPFLKDSNKGTYFSEYSVERKVAITIYKLASCCEYRVVGDVFGVHKSTVNKYFYETVRAINCLKQEYIVFPKMNEALHIAECFKSMSNMEQVIGAIDGTHIPILPPSEGYRDFTNRKGWSSIVMQGVVDNRYRFRDVSVKFPGSVHDSTVFRNSGIYKNCDVLIPKNTKNINGIETPLMLLGDPAYPLLPWLLKPYTGSLDEKKESFNYHLSSSRIVVENAFGRLKGRWRSILKRIDIDYRFVPETILACCILHNIVEDNKEQYLREWDKEVRTTENEYPQPTQSSDEILYSNDAKAIRDNLKEFMANKYPLIKSSRL